MISSSSCDTTHNSSSSSIEYIDPTLPPLLPGRNPKCSLVVLRYDFLDSTVGLLPVSVRYAPPRACRPSSWSHVVLELSASSHGLQKDRVASVLIDGAEILRTSTPNPMSTSASIHWRVRKDVTRYAALLRGDTTVSMTFENTNEGAGIFLGIYSVNVSLHFYHDKVCEEGAANGTVPILKLPAERGRSGYNINHELSPHPKIKGFYDEPADSIVPMSSAACNCSPSGGHWFKIMNETDLHVSTVRVPNNTYRAVLEIYVSHRDDDECWYAEPLESTDHPAGTAERRRNGAFRQVAVSIDKRYVGAVVPFPVIYPSSINPFFWVPVAAIGAYDHPSYDVDLTPFLGALLDGQEHEFGLTVRYGQPHWLVSANLHLWLDPGSDVVTAGLVRYKVPPLKMKRKADWNDDGEGKSSVHGKVIERFSGWVSSSGGNVTTTIKQKLKFKSKVVVKEGGGVKVVELKVKSKTKVRTEVQKNTTAPAETTRQMSVRRDTPVYIRTSRISEEEGNASSTTVVTEKTKMSHQLTETIKLEKREVVVGDRQDSEGWLLIEEDGVIARGEGDTKSTYKFRDDEGCYLRTLIMEGGTLVDDVQAASCASATTEAS